MYWRNVHHMLWVYRGQVGYLAWYISRNVINRSLWAFAKHLCVDACSIALFVGLVYYVLGPIQELHATTYFGWSIHKETVTNFN